jgi:hypothetical protein
MLRSGLVKLTFAGTGDRSDGKAEGPVGISLFGEDATDVVSVKDGLTDGRYYSVGERSII